MSPSRAEDGRGELGPGRAAGARVERRQLAASAPRVVDGREVLVAVIAAEHAEVHDRHEHRAVRERHRRQHAAEQPRADRDGLPRQRPRVVSVASDRRGPRGAGASSIPREHPPALAAADHDVLARHVREDRRQRQVVVAHVVARDLVEPAEPPVARIEREQRVGVQVAAGVRTAVRQRRRPAPRQRVRGAGVERAVRAIVGVCQTPPPEASPGCAQAPRTVEMCQTMRPVAASSESSEPLPPGTCEVVPT